MSKIKTVRIQAHCSDCFDADLKDENGNVLFEYDGYVPGWFVARGSGDAVRMEIDNETGRILNWVPIGDEVLENEED